jgi:hypothetical protein
VGDAKIVNVHHVGVPDPRCCTRLGDEARTAFALLERGCAHEFDGHPLAYDEVLRFVNGASSARSQHALKGVLSV